MGGNVQPVNGEMGIENKTYYKERTIQDFEVSQ